MRPANDSHDNGTTLMIDTGGDTAPVVLFAYNRPGHVRQTLRALRHNVLADSTDLFVYADAPESRDDDCNRVREMLAGIRGFRRVSIVERQCHLGLARSVIAGVSEVMARCGRAIVMEDDLVSSPYFLTYMNEALAFYEQDKKVFSVSGFNFPPDTMNIPSSYPHDVYFSHRSCSWGWGTWADRWTQVDWDVADYPDFVASRKAQRRLQRGGHDMAAMLRDHMQGRVDSWAIRFCYTQSKLGAYAVYPVRSYINNVGLSEAATHRPPPFNCTNELRLARQRCAFVASDRADRRLMRRFQKIYAPEPSWVLRRLLAVTGLHRLMRKLKTGRPPAAT